MTSDAHVLLADLVADVEAHGRSLDELRRELTSVHLSKAASAAIERRERALEADHQRMRQRLIAFKASVTEVHDA